VSGHFWRVSIVPILLPRSDSRVKDGYRGGVLSEDIGEGIKNTLAVAESFFIASQQSG